MPGVADQIRKTQLRQEQKLRKLDMQEIMSMVREGRLHEADERQLEILNLALELQKVGTDASTPPSKETPATIDQDALTNAIKAAMSEIVKQFPQVVGVTGSPPAEDPSRPRMKHTSLTNFVHTDDQVSISHVDKITTEQESAEDVGDKLAKLRKIKGNGG